MGKTVVQKLLSDSHHFFTALELLLLEAGDVFGWMLIERSRNSFVFSIHVADVLVLNYRDFDAGPLSFFINAADRN